MMTALEMWNAGLLKTNLHNAASLEEKRHNMPAGKGLYLGYSQGKLLKRLLAKFPKTRPYPYTLADLDDMFACAFRYGWRPLGHVGPSANENAAFSLLIRDRAIAWRNAQPLDPDPEAPLPVKAVRPRKGYLIGLEDHERRFRSSKYVPDFRRLALSPKPVNSYRWRRFNELPE